jgi:hypothetical protein
LVEPILSAEEAASMRRLSTLMLALYSSVALTGTAIAQEEVDHSQMDHSQMDHSQHNLSQEDYGILREKVLQYRTMSDEAIMGSMMMMPPTYERYLSDTDMSGDLGVIVLAHGAGEPGDTFFANALTGLAKEFPTTIGFGMAMMNGDHLQSATDNLVKAGAKRIVVVPAALSASGSVYEQWAYYFGERDEAAYLPAPQIKPGVPVTLGAPLAQHELITEMLVDHAKEVATDPTNTLVIILGHGPEDYDNNVKELDVLDTHTKRIQKMGLFGDVRAYNLQDDAPDSIRTNNVNVMRSWIENANTFGLDVVITGYLLSTRGIQAGIAEDFAGLDYTFNEKGMSSHPSFIKWIEAGVREYADRM